MKLSSDNGTLSARVHDAFSGGESERRPSLDIELRTTCGKVYLSLPCCFHGLITIHCSRAGIELFPALEKRTALLSDVQGVRVYFVGDRPRSWMSWGDDDDKEGEEGAGVDRYPEEPLDNLYVGSGHEGVKICLEGEPYFW